MMTTLDWQNLSKEERAGYILAIDDMKENLDKVRALISGERPKKKPKKDKRRKGEVEPDEAPKPEARPLPTLQGRRDEEADEDDN